LLICTTMAKRFNEFEVDLNWIYELWYFSSISKQSSLKMVLLGDKERNIILCQRCFPFIGQMMNFSLSKYLLIWTAHARILKQILNVSMVAWLNLGNLRTTTKFTTKRSVDWERTRKSVSAGKRKLKMQSDTECKHKCKTMMFRFATKFFRNGVF